MAQFTLDSGNRRRRPAEPAAPEYLMFMVAERITLTPSASVAFEWMAR